MAETGNSIGEKESDVRKEVVSGGASGEQIPNPHDDDQSVDETSQMGNGVDETEGVSDGALCEPIKNRDDNKSVYEIAETGNSIGEKESDVEKEVVYGGASGEQIPNPHDDDQSLDETSQMGNALCETEAVSDGALAEPKKNHDNKSVDEAAEPGNNSDAEKESDSVKQVIISGGASAEQIPNPHDDDQSVYETSQTGNGVLETERVSNGAPAEPIQNCDDNNSVDEMAKKGNNSGAEKESDAVKQGQHQSHFTVDNQWYHCTEQFIQEKKAIYFNDNCSALKIMAADTALECKQLARNIRNYDVTKWNAVAGELCYNGILEKFNQNPHLNKVLQSTGDKVLAESCYDKKWGTGIPLYSSEALRNDLWTGENLLGKLLTRVRETLHIPEDLD